MIDGNIVFSMPDDRAGKRDTGRRRTKGKGNKKVEEKELEPRRLSVGFCQVIIDRSALVLLVILAPLLFYSITP